MEAPGIDEGQCRKVFDSFGAVLTGMRLAGVTYVAVEALQTLARGAGEAGVAVRVAERGDAQGMHPRIQSLQFSEPDMPALDLQATETPGGHVIAFGVETPAEEVMNLFFDLDVGRLPFEEAVQRTGARRLAALPLASVSAAASSVPALRPAGRRRPAKSH
jgi:hypothetical protein